MFIGGTGMDFKLIHYFCALVNINYKTMERTNLLLYISAFLLLGLLGGCSSSDKASETPGDVAVALYSALTSGDAETVKRYLYISNKQQRSTFFKYLDVAVNSKQYKDNTQGYVAKYSVAEESVDGDTANVVLVGMGPLGQQLRITVKMLMVDGSWMVDGDHGVWQKND